LLRQGFMQRQAGQSTNQKGRCLGLMQPDNIKLNYLEFVKDRAVVNVTRTTPSPNKYI